MAGDEALIAVLRLAVGGTSGPSTPEGKFLAMALCLFPVEASEPLADKPSLFPSVQISALIGARAYRDLERCQWILEGGFRPKINVSRRGAKHIDAIRAVLSGYQNQDQDWFPRRFGKRLSVNNRLLLVILLDREEHGGRLRPTSLGDLAKLTGFSPNQVKVQLQKLKEVGLVSGVVPGVSGAAVFGIAKSYIYLNLLHPFWGCFFPAWRAICLGAPIWQDISREESSILYRLMGDGGHAELRRRPELRRYFRNVVLVLISGVLSRSWHELRMNSPTFLQGEQYFAERLLRAELPVSDIPWFMIQVRRIASQVQSKLCNGDGDLAEVIGDASWSFCVLPDFSDCAQPLVVLTNCGSISNGIDSTWLRSNDHAHWIEKGLLTRPDAAPLKLRSRKPKPF